jgi:hypothetical protein
MGPNGPKNVYAGGGSLYETRDLLNWKKIADDSIRDVHRIAVLMKSKRIVVATRDGIFWSDIPAAGGSYTFKAAIYDATAAPLAGKVTGSWFGLAPSGFREFRHGSKDSIVASPYGGVSATGFYGLFTGRWNGSDLILSRATINGFDATKIFSACITSCAKTLSTLYASVSNANPGNLLGVLKSTDAGTTWNPCRNVIRNSDAANTVSQLEDAAGEQGNIWNNCISVAPFDPDWVALGWQHGPFVSQDGGNTWFAVESQNWHADIHGLTFAVSIDPPKLINSPVLYVASDGGIASTNVDSFDFFQGTGPLIGPSGFGQSPNTQYNQYLPNLQFVSSNSIRGYPPWHGQFSGSEDFDGLIAGGVFDNGNIYNAVGPSDSPWNKLEGGDGMVMLFVQGGEVLHYNNENLILRSSVWNGNGFDDTNPADVQIQNSPNPLRHPVVSRVRSPVSDSVPVAFGAVKDGVYGLYGTSVPKILKWRFLSTLPSDAGDVKSLASEDGLSVYVGTSSSRLFNLQAPTFSVNEIAMAGSNGSFDQILIVFSNLIFIAMNTYLPYPSPEWGDVVRLYNGQPDLVSSHFPRPLGVIRSMEKCWPLKNNNIFVATDRYVFLSRDYGSSWEIASQGLPNPKILSYARFETPA